MKIREVRLIRLQTIEEIGALEPAWDPGGRMVFQRGGGSVLEIHSDQGLVGIGPGVDPSLLPALQSRLVGRTRSIPSSIPRPCAITRRVCRTAGAPVRTSPCQRLSPRGDSLSLDYNSLRSTGG
jgi:hypothetical protein